MKQAILSNIPHGAESLVVGGFEGEKYFIYLRFRPAKWAQFGNGLKFFAPQKEIIQFPGLGYAPL